MSFTDSIVTTQDRSMDRLIPRMRFISIVLASTVVTVTNGEGSFFRGGFAQGLRDGGLHSWWHGNGGDNNESDSGSAWGSEGETQGQGWGGGNESDSVWVGGRNESNEDWDWSGGNESDANFGWGGGNGGNGGGNGGNGGGNGGWGGGQNGGGNGGGWGHQGSNDDEVPGCGRPEIFFGVNYTSLNCSASAATTLAPKCSQGFGIEGEFVCRTLFNRVTGEKENFTECIDPDEALPLDECGCCGSCPEPCPCSCQLWDGSDGVQVQKGGSASSKFDFGMCMPSDKAMSMVARGIFQCSANCTAPETSNTTMSTNPQQGTSGSTASPSSPVPGTTETAAPNVATLSP